AKLVVGLAVWRASFQFAFADSYISLGPKELQLLSERVVRVKVTGVRSEWNTGRTFVFTYVTLDIQRYHKGAGPATIEVRVPGGKVGNYSVTAESMPKFETGDDVLVFLSHWNDGAIKVEGYFQGVSRVVASPKGPMLRGGSLDNRLLNEAEKEIGAQ
ncbi:MAG: hypothetical protein ACREQW_13545, partial [Candidatus Binatia bacterium]